MGEGGAQLAVPVPAAQHELIQTLGTYGWPAQVHLGEGEINLSKLVFPPKHDTNWPVGPEDQG